MRRQLTLVFVLLAAGPLSSLQGGEQDSPLLREMLGLKQNLKGVAMAMRDPAQRSQCLEHVARLQHHLLAAKALEPANLADQPEADRAAHTNAFRTELARVLRAVCDLEVALREERVDDAWALVAGDLYQLREAAHERFQ